MTPYDYGRWTLFTEYNYTAQYHEVVGHQKGWDLPPGEYHYYQKDNGVLVEPIQESPDLWTRNSENMTGTVQWCDKQRRLHKAQDIPHKVITGMKRFKAFFE